MKYKNLFESELKFRKSLVAAVLKVSNVDILQFVAGNAFI